MRQAARAPYTTCNGAGTKELPELRVVELPELRVVELLPELLPRRVCAAISGATSMARASIMEAANVINLLIALSF